MKLEIIEKRQTKEDKSSKQKLRVAAYVRVSSKHDDQLDSFESQVKYFYEKIIANPDWEFIRIYSDEGISGTNTNHRKGFNENGENESYIIRFICKSKYNYKTRYDLTDDFIVENSDLRKDNLALIPIIDFISNQHFFVFDTEEGRRIKKLITKVRVRVEIER